MDEKERHRRPISSFPQKRGIAELKSPSAILSAEAASVVRGAVALRTVRLTMRAMIMIESRAMMSMISTIR